MATKKKTTKKTINFEKSYNQLMKDMDSVCFRMFELKDEVFNGTISNKDLIEELWNVTNMMSNSLSTADQSTDPLYKDLD